MVIAGLLASAPLPWARAGAPAAPSPADVKRAEELYDNGRQLYAEGSYRAAAIAFEQAYALSGNLDMLYNAALAYDRADAFDEAISTLDRYRALAPASERAKLDERKRSLEVRRDRQREAATGGPSTDAPPSADAPTGSDSPYPAAGKQPRDRLFGPAAWALTGTAIAAFGMGTGFGVASLVRTRSAREHCADDPMLCQTAARGDARRASSYALVADISFAVGGALTVALVTIVAVNAVRAKKARAQSSARARVEPSGTGAVVRF